MGRYQSFLSITAMVIGILVATSFVPGSSLSQQQDDGDNEIMVDDLRVYLGYADVAPNFASQNFPSPWEGSENVIFVGNGVGTTQDYDSGAIRIDNPTSSSVTITSVTVDLPGTECNPDPYGCRPLHFDIWPHDLVIPPGNKLILTENSPQMSNMSNFDTSDRNFTNCDSSYWSAADHHDPLITITTPIDSKIINDTGHILDTGGMDVAVCLGNESAPWTLVWPSIEDQKDDSSSDVEDVANPQGHS